MLEDPSTISSCKQLKIVERSFNGLFNILFLFLQLKWLTHGVVPANMRICAQPLCNTVMWISIIELKVLDIQDSMEVCHICAGSPVQIKHTKRQLVKVSNCILIDEIRDLLEHVQR